MDNKTDTSNFTEGTPLTEQELAWFNDQFFSPVWFDRNKNIAFNIRNMFLAPQYSSVEQINFALLFYDGIDWHDPVPQEEIDALDKKVGNNMPLDTFKIPKRDMEAAFLEHTGLTIDQTQKIGLDRLVYLEEYNAYYCKHGDTNYGLYQMKEGVRLDDGTVILLYAHKYERPTRDMKVTLRPSGDSYWFISNLPA